ncbi:MAG: hypothetical protein ABIB04_01465 [Patescibacteria group bacterium]
MAKKVKKSVPVTMKKDDRRIVITISRREVERRVRKRHAPPTQVHRQKTTYRRKPKHPGRIEEG